MSNQNLHTEHDFELVSRKLSGELSASEEQDFERWLAQSESNRRLFQETQFLWLDPVHGKEEEPVFDVDAAWSKVDLKTADSGKDEVIATPLVVSINRKPKLYYILGALAAGLALLFSLNYLNTDPIELQMLSEITKDDAREILLADGTIIMLNEDSKIIFVKDLEGDEREIWLEGQAYFDVARNEEKPFVIHTRLMDVRVLGTSFYVREKPTRTEVDVVSGHVQLINLSDATDIMELNKNENAFIVAELDAQITKTELLLNELFWKTNTLIFQDIKLKEVVKLLSTSFKKDVVLVGSEMEMCPLTATFEKQSLEDILIVIESVFNCEINEGADGVIEIEGTTCK